MQAAHCADAHVWILCDGHRNNISRTKRVLKRSVNIIEKLTKLTLWNEIREVFFFFFFFFFVELTTKRSGAERQQRAEQEQLVVVAHTSVVAVQMSSAAHRPSVVAAGRSRVAAAG
jgi:hypothetical protein